MSKRSLDERLYVPNPKEWIELNSKQYHSDRTLTVKKIERGVILPARPLNEHDKFKCNGGVCDADLNFIDGHNDVITDPWSGNYVLNGAYAVEPEEIIESDDEVIYGGALIYHFGHFLTESLARMWFYRAHGFKVVYPEKLSIVNQIALIAGAKEIVTYLGTLSHWALFCKPDTKFTMLMRVDDALDFDQTKVRQSLINEASGVDWELVSVARSFLFALHGLGECLIGSTEHWKKYVLDRFGEHLDPDEEIPCEIADNYIERWCQFFSTPGLRPYRIKSIKDTMFENKALKLTLDSGHPALCCQAYAAQLGWLAPTIEGEICGLSLQDIDMQAFRAQFIQPFCDVIYSVYYADEGWTKPVANGQMTGDLDGGKAICGLSMRLDSTEFDIRYRVHSFDSDWSEWTYDGGEISSNYALNAVQIKVIPRGVSTKGAD